MPVRDGPLKPMTMSGHCAWPSKGSGHGFCSGKACTCPCHSDPKFVDPFRASSEAQPSKLPSADTKPKLQLRKRRAK